MAMITLNGSNHPLESPISLTGLLEQLNLAGKPVVIELNEEAKARMVCPTELVIVPGATHLFEEAGTLEQVAELASAWFVRYLSATK
jgi:putative phosphoribosyl transferase